jgi:hypothetical protein
MNTHVWQWLLDSDEPWTRYRTMVDLFDRRETDPEVQAARGEMLAHPLVKSLIEYGVSWPGYGLKRHNDARHPIFAIATLADFGLVTEDPGMENIVSALMSHQAEEGPFQTKLFLYKRFAGVEGEHWAWMMCDAPTILYALISLGLGENAAVQRASHHLISQLREVGWPCAAGDPMGPGFKGPGKRGDPCPYANLISLKAITLLPSKLMNDTARMGAEILLRHWEHDYDRKLYLFGVGTDYRKLKYPFVWYDVLHVAEVLSRFPFLHSDSRLQELVSAITEQADEDGLYTAKSMYMAWKGWSFADKKSPSPWLTFLVERIKHRMSIAA